jgi:hypothetical protein
VNTLEWVMVKALGVHIKEIVQTQYIIINMTEQEILKFGEIQYLKGRLDELYKAIPTVTNMERRRKLDQRIEKYITKLKKVDEVAYRLYEVELNATHRVKVKGKLETENLFKEILLTEQITDETIIKKIKDKLETL